jgi:hypothetical protein
MRPIHKTESAGSHPQTIRLQSAKSSMETLRRSTVEPPSPNQDRWRESQLEEPERWDGMS